MQASILLSILSGILYVLAFPPFHLAHLMWVAFLPLFYAIEKLPKSKRTAKTIFGMGFCTSFVIAAGGFYWLIHSTENYGELPWIAAFGVFIAFCFVGNLQVPLYAVARNHLKRNVVLLGVIYTGVEALYPKLFTETAGHVFAVSPLVRQAADLGGAYLLTFFVVLVNELLFSGFYFKNKKAWLPLAGVAAFFLAYGSFRNQVFRDDRNAHEKDPSFSVKMVQANIGDYIKVAAERGEDSAVRQVLGTYITLSKKAASESPDTDAIIWPETAYPAVYHHPMSFGEVKMEQLLREFQTGLKPYFIFGGYDRDQNGLEYNSLFFSHAGTDQVYHKSILLMFGETLPFAETFPSMKRWFPNMGFFGRGPGAEVFTVKNQDGHEFKLAASICYEDLLPEHSIEGALKGADALLNVTNDSWFGKDGEPGMHLGLARFRAIETRLPLIRSTNTGYTVFVDASGEVIERSPLFAEAIISAKITNKSDRMTSPYLRVASLLGANWFTRFCSLVTVIALILSLRKKNGS